MKFVMNRDRIVPTTMGHVIGFKKGVPTDVPYGCHDAVIAAGADPHEGEVPEKTKAGKEPAEKQARDEALAAASAKLAAANKSSDFTAGGSPSMKAITRELGWTPEADELAAAWAAHTLAAAAK